MSDRPRRKGTPGDPRGLIQEAFRIHGITPEACRTIFLDWALGLPEDANAREEITRLLAIHVQEEDDHPMKHVLREGLLEPKAAPRRRRRSRSVS